MNAMGSNRSPKRYIREPYIFLSSRRLEKTLLRLKALLAINRHILSHGEVLA